MSHIQMTRTGTGFASPAATTLVRLAITIVGAVFLAACSRGGGSASTPTPEGTSSTAEPSPSEKFGASSLRAVDWPNSQIPGSVCGGTGSVMLQNGRAVVDSTLRTEYPTVVMRLDEPVSYGDIDEDGAGSEAEEAAVPVSCNNGGGMAGGQIVQSIVVFAPGEGGLRVIGPITTRQPDMAHTQSPYFNRQMTRLTPGQVSVEEIWFGSRDSTCCPSGRARTVWTFDGTTLTPGDTTVTAEPVQAPSG